MLSEIGKSYRKIDGLVLIHFTAGIITNAKTTLIKKNERKKTEFIAFNVNDAYFVYYYYEPVIERDE